MKITWRKEDDRKKRKKKTLQVKVTWLSLSMGGVIKKTDIGFSRLRDICSYF